MNIRVDEQALHLHRQHRFLGSLVVLAGCAFLASALFWLWPAAILPLLPQPIVERVPPMPAPHELFQWRRIGYVAVILGLALVGAGFAMREIAGRRGRGRALSADRAKS